MAVGFPGRQVEFLRFIRRVLEKTAEMDAKLAKVSSTMAEFVAGISVVKAFGRVGRAHSAYVDSADEFSRFFRAWALPLVSISCVSMAWISIPLLLVVTWGAGPC